MPERSKAPDPREETPDDRPDACPVRSKTCDSAVCMAGNLRAGRTVQHDRSSDRYRVSGDDTDDVGNGGYGMKKRLEKKVEKMRRKKVHEILEMVLEINGTYPRQREYSGSLPTAFFEFSGHVSRVYVQVIRDGWNDRGNLYDPDSDWMDVRTELDEMEELKGKVKEKQEELRHAGKM